MADLKGQLTSQLDRVRGRERGLGRIIPSVFAHLRGRRRRGSRIRDLRKA
jgi:hypothetical protein